MKIIKTLTIFCMFFSSCHVEPVSILKGFLINNSTVPILILPYSNGFLVTKEIKIMNYKDTLNIGDGSVRGRFNSYGFYSELINNYTDSVQIVYNSIDTVTHYCYDSVEKKRLKSYEIGSPHNIFNGKNYYLNVTNISKNKRINENYFTFTEDDYNFAKEP